MGKGALLGLLMLPLGTCLCLILVFGVIPAYHMEVFVFPVFSVIGVIVLWLTTSPEPGNPYWLIYLRWATRAGILMGLAWQIVRIGVLHSPLMTAEDFAAPYGLLILAGSAGSAADMWYCSRLGRRLGDRILRISFGILKWIFGLFFVLTAFSAAYDWEKFCGDQAYFLTHAGQYWATAYRTWTFLLVWTGIYLFLGLLFGWLQWRLWRRLRTTANSLREMGEGLSGEKLQ